MTSRQVINDRTGRVVLTDAPRTERAWGGLKRVIPTLGLLGGAGLPFQSPRGIRDLDRTESVSTLRRAMRPRRLDLTNAARLIETNPGAARIDDTRPGDRPRFEPRPVADA